jgi:hypothetical protein
MESLLATRPASISSWPDTVPSEDRTLGWSVLEWTATYLQQPDGPNAGQPWEFTTEQAKIVLRWYAIGPDGRFLYRRGVLRRMKGWGKDPFGAALAAVELCGPCRFGGWGADKHPIAISHPAAWIQVAAVAKDQTTNAMSLFPGLLSPACKTEYGIDMGKEIIYSRTGGRIQAVTSSPRALEGGRPSLVLADETQHWLPQNDGIAMMAAIRRNLGKSRDGAARVLEITNAHLVDEGSAAESTYEAWRASDGKLPGVYYDALEAPPLEDITDLAKVRDGLVAARGDSTWVDVDRILQEITDPTTSESIARRYYLNQVWAAANEEWLPVGSWGGVKDESVEIPEGSAVILAVDGSYNDDSTAVMVASCSSIPHLEVVGCWEQPEAQEGEWTVPILEVEEAIRAACKRWRVRELCFDPYRWARTMQVLKNDGLPVVEFPQSPERMIPAAQRFQEAVLNGTLTHTGDDRLARHVGNVVVKESSRGLQIRKETKWSPRKIDLAVAAVMAHDRAASRERTSGWLTYFKQEVKRQEIEVKEPEAQAVSPSQFFSTERPKSAIGCKHRWHPLDNVCVHCGIPRES